MAKPSQETLLSRTVAVVNGLKAARKKHLNVIKTRVNSVERGRKKRLFREEKRH